MSNQAPFIQTAQRYRNYEKIDFTRN